MFLKPNSRSGVCSSFATARACSLMLWRSERSFSSYRIHGLFLFFFVFGFQFSIFIHFRCKCLVKAKFSQFKLRISDLSQLFLNFFSIFSQFFLSSSQHSFQLIVEDGVRGGEQEQFQPCVLRLALHRNLRRQKFFATIYFRFHNFLFRSRYRFVPRTTLCETLRILLR
jgi:hypothetical protein